MTWQLSGTLRHVRYAIDPQGRRYLMTLSPPRWSATQVTNPLD